MSIRRIKKQLVRIFLMVLSLTWIGCGSESQLPQAVPEQTLSFNVKVSNYQADDSQESRAVTTGYDTQFENGDAFGLFVLDNDGTITYQNTKVTLQNGEWTPEKYVTYLYTRKYFAYAPYNEEYSDKDKYKTIEDVRKALAAFVPNKVQDTKDAYAANDLLVASDDLQNDLIETTSGGRLDLTFRHQMALLELSIDKQEADFVYATLNGGEPIKMFPTTVAMGTTKATVYRCIVSPGTYTVGGTFFKDGVRNIIKEKEVTTEKGKYSRINVK